MPTYEYQCEQCGEEFEYFQSIKAAPKEVCERCGGHLTKLVSAGAGLIFKGSGFYITDYKKQNASPASVSSHSNGHKAAESAKSEAAPAAGESSGAAKSAPWTGGSEKK